MSIIREFYQYQKVRFPLKVLFLTTAVSVGTTAAVLFYNTTLLQAAIAFTTTMLLLFHIRVNDELRDFNEDAKLHKEMPQHSGIISIKKLQFLDAISVLFYLLLSWYSGDFALMYGASAIFFVALARKDFFLKKHITHKPIWYHIINSPQMFLLQLQMYAILSHSAEISNLMWLNIILVYANIFILEVIRKIKLPQDEVKGSYSFSQVYGFKKAIVISYVWAIVSTFAAILLILFARQVNSSHILYGGLIIFVFLLFLLLTIAYEVHKVKQTKKSEKLMLASSIGLYLFSHIFVIIAFIPWN